METLKPMILRTLITTSALLCLAAPALAQTAAPAGMTLAQFQAERADKMFARLDANKDGKVAVDEMPAKGLRKADPAGDKAGGEKGGDKPGDKAGKRGQIAFARTDANKDNALTRAEVNAMLAERFKRKDTNNDGVLSPEELKARPERAKVGV